MYDFSNYKTFRELYRDLYYKEMKINNAEMRQNEFISITDALNDYIPKSQKYNEAKNSLLNNAKDFYEGREKIIEGFKNGMFSKSDDDNDDDEQQQASKKIIKDNVTFNEWIDKEETDINKELFKEHFNFQRPSDMLKYLHQANDRAKNNKLVSVIICRLEGLKKKIREMSEEEREIEKPDKIVKIVKKILKFNKEKQKGQGLKVLIPSQIFSRLPISSAQLKAGNNPEKLKNEIRQILYSLYRSKNLSKQVYNNLIKHI